MLRRWFSRLVSVLLVATAAYVGGVAVTQLWPATVQTDYYRGEVTMTLLPTSTLSASTVLGDVEARFDGPVPAPGVRVLPQVKRDVTTVFSRPDVNPEQLVPSEKQLREVATEALVAVALRFLLGAALVVLALLALISVGRRGAPGRVVRTVTAVGTVAALAATTLVGWGTYRQSNLRSVEASSLLGLVRTNAGMLTDVQKRSAEASRYVTNVLALSQSLNNVLVPPGAREEPALRVLFISDVHAQNQYPILKRVVQEEKIDVVVDSGDLVNFGRVQEGDASGLFSSIAGLGVPYVFVRGNHDATSAADEDLLRRLDQIPNVFLPEPRRGEYHQITVGGVRIGGFNDPRWYGDSDPDDTTAQDDRRKEFLRAYEGKPLPDVVVGHEPASLSDMPGESLLVNGHTHQPGVNGHRVTVGTFTGGGLFGRRVQSGAQPGTERVTSSYYFDIGVYDRSCSLSTLTRYAFKDIVEGAPVYESVGLLNGRSIVPEVKDRTCSATQPVQRESVD